MNPTKKYIPNPNKTIEYQDLPDGFFIRKYIIK